MTPLESSSAGSWENPFGEKNYQLPDGGWVSLRVESDSLHSQWTYFWISFVTGKVRPAWYRVFPVGSPPPEWRPMKPAGAVDKQTGMDDFDSEKDAQERMRDNKGKIGVAKKLKPGRYILQSKIRVGSEDLELKSVEFQVSKGPFGAGWG